MGLNLPKGGTVLKWAVGRSQSLLGVERKTRDVLTGWDERPRRPCSCSGEGTWSRGAMHVLLGQREPEEEGCPAGDLEGYHE